MQSKVPNILLIHGNATGISFPFRKAPTNNGNFEAFDDMIDSGKAQLFLWANVNEKFNWLQTLNPFEFKRQYDQEKNYINSQEAIDSLSTFLRQNPNIDTIIAHSMGCQYTLNCLANCPNSFENIRSVHLCSADVNCNYLLNPTQKPIPIYNYYIPLDPMLALSVIRNGNIRAGSCGFKDSKNSNIKNIRWTDYNFDIHHSIVRSKRFASTF